MSVTEAQVLEALKRVKGPDLDSNLVDLGLVSEVLIKDSRVYFSITIDPKRAEELEPLRQAAAKVVTDIDGVAGATAVLTADAPAGGAAPMPQQRTEHPRVAAARRGGQAPPNPQAAPAPAAPKARAGEGIPGVKHLIAVASGKGGVGKSTTTVNLALALQANGLKVGVLDADIYGPSQPRLLGLAGRPQQGANDKLQPMSGYGLKAMSMGFLVEEGTPIIWRGPMVVSALNQMLREVNWGELDAILIDMPPGTGDVQLTMAQQVPLSGAVIVSTPQDLALIDARKGLAMFQRVDVPVLGIIENMSYFICPSCGERSDIFGHGGASIEAEKLGVPFLGGVPLHMDIRATSDAGQPIVVTAPESEHATIYGDLASRVWAETAAAAGTLRKPELAVNTANNMLTVKFEDGDTYELSAEMLRVMSPSAEVQGHAPSQRVTVGGKRHVTIGDLRPVGSYAVRIVFSDGHDTGLFSWDYLEELGREKDARWADYEAELAAKGLSRE
ncbi:MAG: iron-sulfur cluster carrier protein ApbC [Hyphomicrobiaceae bacterium]